MKSSRPESFESAIYDSGATHHHSRIVRDIGRDFVKNPWTWLAPPQYYILDSPTESLHLISKQVKKFRFFSILGPQGNFYTRGGAATWYACHNYVEKWKSRFFCEKSIFSPTYQLKSNPTQNRKPEKYTNKSGRFHIIEASAPGVGRRARKTPGLQTRD